MRLPRVQFTVRRMMVAVALLGVFFGITVVGNRILQRHRRFRSAASHFANLEDLERDGVRHYEVMAEPWAKLLEPGKSSGLVYDEMMTFRVKADASRRKADYYANLVNKYERASTRPWNSVSPDPPEP